MRKYHQKMILDLLRTLVELTDEAKELSSVNLLADCQDGAIKIGNLIESLEGEGHITVKYLEEYCEMLYQASKKLTERVNLLNVFKRLKKHLIKIINSVNNDIEIKLEMVFFPYKASMFDAFESIWSAAKDDQNCEVYVVPIPYYDKNPDGTLGQVFYEGNLYRNDILVTDYQSYDIEERHPDLVFIHNPYDNANYVTTVHPDFYAERLSKFTDMLVYIPYFVTGDYIDESFCVLPGTLYAHKIFVQSESIKRKYVKCYKSFEKENNCHNRFGKADDKFIALGSPKFDAVINMQVKYDVPEDWQNLINNSDGTAKKVIFLNTSISGLLNGDEEILHKLRHIFECFRKNKNVVLLWRPHPLSASTCKSMRPGLLREYLEIINDFCCENFGIYDDSPDPHRAMALSDAYYGDMSSLVYMYGMTGKPIVIHDVKIMGEQQSVKVCYFETDNDGNAWAFDRYYDGLFRLDFTEKKAKLMIQSGQMRMIDEIEQLFGPRYHKIHVIDDLIICLPLYLDSIFIYNRETDEHFFVMIDKSYFITMDIDDGYGTYFSVEHQKKIFCFGVYLKSIIVFDAIENKIEYDDRLYDQIGLLAENAEYIKYPLYIDECSAEGKVTLILRGCEHMIRYSLVSGEVEYVASNLRIGKCYRATLDSNYAWLIKNTNDMLMRWDYCTDEIVEYPFEKTDAYGFVADEYVFANVIDCGDYLLLLPNFNDKTMKFDKLTSKYSQYMDLPEAQFFFNNKNIDEKCFFFTHSNSTVYSIDTLSGDIKTYEFLIDRDDLRKLCARFYANIFAENDDILYERNQFGNMADFFMASLSGINEKRKEEFFSFSFNKDGTAGKAIFDYLRWYK